MGQVWNCIDDPLCQVNIHTFLNFYTLLFSYSRIPNTSISLLSQVGGTHSSGENILRLKCQTLQNRGQQQDHFVKEHFFVGTNRSSLHGQRSVRWCPTDLNCTIRFPQEEEVPLCQKQERAVPLLFLAPPCTGDQANLGGRRQELQVCWGKQSCQRGESQWLKSRKP